ncbi:MAG: enolase C-terminal domain-like protein [Bacteroidota bacterium]
MDRRDAIKNIGLGITGLSAGSFAAGDDPFSQKTKERFMRSTNGLPDLSITDVKAIPVQPGGIELVVVKVETSEPGLYGIGCATFRQRAHAVVTAIERYLKDFCVGKSVNNIEDMWQMCYQSSYWRNGPVLNNALSGLDQALWDIKGKRANMPLYELFGGKCRFAADTYAHMSGNSKEEVAENVLGAMEDGYRHVRIQMGGYTGPADQNPDFRDRGFGHERDQYMDQKAYLRAIPEMFAEVRKVCGERVELLHDIHERIQPMDAINMCKTLEEYRPFFIEDPLSPENNDYFKLMRQHTTVPIAMGELYNNPHEWLGPISKRWFDFIRIHISQIGGLTPAMKVARMAEWFNVRTTWHGPGDCSPVGHACNAHASLATWNFGVLEMTAGIMNEQLREIFPGAPRIEKGYAFVNEAPGHGVDIDEELAAKFPLQDVQLNTWTQVRSYDGTPIRP